MSDRDEKKRGCVPRGCWLTILIVVALFASYFVYLVWSAGSLQTAASMQGRSTTSSKIDAGPTS